MHVADENQTVLPKSLQGSREVKNLGSVNNAGRKESLAISESSRSKRPTLDTAKKIYDYALSKVNQELREFMDTYPKNVFVPVEERPDTKARYKDLKGRRAHLECEAKELRALLSKDRAGTNTERS